MEVGVGHEGRTGAWLNGRGVCLAWVTWGKLRRAGPEVLVHPLVNHMLDVAACFRAMARCGAVRRALDSAVIRRTSKRAPALRSHQ